MQNRTRTVASPAIATLLTGVIAGFAGGDVARGADECLAAPKSQTPPGGHWHYRTDHATHRNCWYVKGDSAKSDAAAAPPPPSADGAAPETAALPPATANAHAEMTAAAPSVAPPRVEDVAAASDAAIVAAPAAGAHQPDAAASVRLSDAEPSTTGDAAPSSPSAFAPPSAAPPGADATPQTAAAAADTDAIGPLRMILGVVFIAAGLCTIIAALLVRFVTAAQARAAMASEQERGRRPASMTQAV